MNPALQTWLDAVRPTDRTAEAKAFLGLFGREHEGLTSRAVAEYLANPDRRGRPILADLSRTVARLKMGDNASTEESQDRALVDGGCAEMYGFERVTPERSTPDRQVAAWLRQYVTLLGDLCLWAHDRPSTDPMIIGMRQRFEATEAALGRAGFVQRRDHVGEWRSRAVGRGVLMAERSAPDLRIATIAEGSAA